jgi:predicted transcriptional regulator
MMKNADVCKYPEGGIQRLKRKRADILLAARPDLSDRELARLAGVSHTYIARRRRVATNAPTA